MRLFGEYPRPEKAGAEYAVSHASAPVERRVAWIDYAKGICIIFVVMLYAVQWVEEAMGRRGWLHLVVDFAQPYRMPDFFLISGLLLSKTIGRDWRTYLDRKVLHFAYFYTLWLTIEFVVRAPSLAAGVGWDGLWDFYIRSFVEPFAMLWFIYLLSIFYVATKVLRQVPVPAVIGAAALLHLLWPVTGIAVLDKFAMYFVFFFTGYAAARFIIAFGGAVASRPRLALASLGIWGAFEGFMAFGTDVRGPVMSLFLGFLGSAAIIAIASLLSQRNLLPWLRYCGANSLAIYLAFFIPLMASRYVLTHSGLVDDPGTVSLLVLVVSVWGALAIQRIAKPTRFRFLFERPKMFSLAASGSRYPKNVAT